MGMYTSYHFKTKLDTRGVEIVKDLNYFNRFKGYSGCAWDKVAEKCNFASINSYVEYARRDFIPFGSGGIIPDEWQNDEDDPWNDVIGNIWEGVCSLKNYEHEIQAFHDLILCEVSEEILISELVYEEFVREYECGEYQAVNLLKGK